MTTIPDDWDVLGLEPGADLLKVRRAYRERRALYEGESLATYNLLEDEERAKIVARIDAAYENIVGTPPAPVEGRLHPATAAAEADPPKGPAPDPAAEPGAHLRHRRLLRGDSLHHVESITKIGVPILEQIENEIFDALPAAVFVRGHVEQFAREIGIDDPVEFAQLYLAKMHGGNEG